MSSQTRCIGPGGGRGLRLSRQIRLRTPGRPRSAPGKRPHLLGRASEATNASRSADDLDSVVLDDKYYQEMGMTQQDIEDQQALTADDIDPEAENYKLEDLFSPRDGTPQEIIDAYYSKDAYGPEVSISSRAYRHSFFLTIHAKNACAFVAMVLSAGYALAGSIIGWFQIRGSCNGGLSQLLARDESPANELYGLMGSFSKSRALMQFSPPLQSCVRLVKTHVRCFKGLATMHASCIFWTWPFCQAVCRSLQSHCWCCGAEKLPMMCMRCNSGPPYAAAPPMQGLDEP